MSEAVSLISDDVLLANYTAVTDKLRHANAAANRQAPARLLAVSKTKPASMIRTLFNAGQKDFGENYLQEALAKMDELTDLALVWHYIGSIQRNKTRDIATHFDWVHTLEREVIAKRLNEQRDGMTPLNALIQVNIDDEDSKSGCQIADVPALAQYILGCENLHLRGLMVIPSKEGSDAFMRTERLFLKIKDSLQPPHWDSISMGMSGDMADAVAHGSTMVRVGTAIFGSRPVA